MPEHISSLAMDGDAVWASSGQYVMKYLRGKEVSHRAECAVGLSLNMLVQVFRFSNPVDTVLSCIILFGSQLLALTEDGRRMLMWETSEGGRRCSFHLESPCSFEPTAMSSTIQFDLGFTATSILHPATYLNKVLVASSEGHMQLWNIRTKSLLTFYSILRFLIIIPQQKMHPYVLTFSSSHIPHTPLC